MNIIRVTVTSDGQTRIAVRAYLLLENGLVRFGVIQAPGTQIRVADKILD